MAWKQGLMRTQSYQVFFLDLHDTRVRGAYIVFFAFFKRGNRQGTDGSFHYGESSAGP